MKRQLIALRTLRSQNGRTRVDIENFRDRQIRELVAHAYAKVPFYRKLYDRHGIAPNKIRGFGDLPMLPLVVKDELRRAAVSELVARGVDHRDLHARLTTGTTGEPMSVRRTARESAVLKLYRFQAFRSLGVRRRDLAVNIRLPRPSSANPTIRPLRRIANRIGFYPRVTLVAEDPTSLLKDLNELSPAVLGGVPGVLSTIVARWPADAREEVRSATWPRILMTGGERLTSSVRHHLEDVFGAGVIDMYASEEFNLIAMQCRVTGAYHVSDESVALEVIDGTHSVVRGETGQPVGTALHSFAAPLIRFPLGDLVTMGATPCECGMPHSTISEIQGRVVHFLELPDGFVIHHVKIEQAVGYEASWARQVQISQPSIDMLGLRIAPLREPSTQEIDTLRVAIAAYLHDRVSVDIIIDPDLGPEAGEKFLPIVPRPKKTAAPDADAADQT